MLLHITYILYYRYIFFTAQMLFLAECECPCDQTPVSHPCPNKKHMSPSTRKRNARSKKNNGRRNGIKPLLVLRLTHMHRQKISITRQPLVGFGSTTVGLSRSKASVYSTFSSWYTISSCVYELRTTVTVVQCFWGSLRTCTDRKSVLPDSRHKAYWSLKTSWWRSTNEEAGHTIQIPHVASPRNTGRQSQWFVVLFFFSLLFNLALSVVQSVLEDDRQYMCQFGRFW
jgi:hypothetical protein